ncbi:hypothetical protein [Kushneria aurantia]|uniref:Uncharacterized protein n=1 Tax=Kushneria aurantia TaxID=504092 RepID=A0ABV6G233_9GAMM|nr:hypothetical protein [Kushneria aurantia]
MARRKPNPNRVTGLEQRLRRKHIDPLTKLWIGISYEKVGDEVTPINIPGQLGLQKFRLALSSSRVGVSRTTLAGKAWPPILNATPDQTGTACWEIE